MSFSKQIKSLKSELNRTRDGYRLAIPVLGNGLNIQAYRASNLSSEDEWPRILMGIGKQVGINVAELNDISSSTLSWEMLFRSLAHGRRANHLKSETRLNEMLITRLRRIERESKSLSFYRQILAGRFSNVISFNIDRRLSLHGEKSAFVKATRHRLFDPEDKKMNEKEIPDEFGRHSVVTLPGGKITRIWYPFGDTRDHQTIRLGMAWHADRLVEQEMRRGDLMDRWSVKDYAGESAGSPMGVRFERSLRAPGKFYRELLDMPPSSWFDLFFTAPLVFIGTTLPPEDWPIWWMLHQRARNFVPFGSSTQVPKTYFLTADEQGISHLAGSPSNIEIIQFPSYDDLWGRLLKILAA